MRPPPFLARQLARPSGFFGRFVMGRFLNRTTAAHNAMVLEDLAVESTSRVLEIGTRRGGVQTRVTPLRRRHAWDLLLPGRGSRAGERVMSTFRRRQRRRQAW
jgi:hypothetical protein